MYFHFYIDSIVIILIQVKNYILKMLYRFRLNYFIMTVNIVPRLQSNKRNQYSTIFTSKCIPVRFTDG